MKKKLAAFIVASAMSLCGCATTSLPRNFSTVQPGDSGLSCVELEQQIALADSLVEKATRALRGGADRGRSCWAVR